MGRKKHEQYGEYEEVKSIEEAVSERNDYIVATVEAIQKVQIYHDAFSVSSWAVDYEGIPSEQVSITFTIPLINGNPCFADALRKEYTRVVMEKSPDFAEQIYLEMKAKK